MNQLLNYIKTIVNLTDECASNIKLNSKEKLIAKNETVLNKGAKANTEIFLSEGIIRAFLIDKQGNEKNTAFYEGGEFISTSALRSKNGYSIYTYEALTNCVIYIIDSGKFNELLRTHTPLMDAAKLVKEKEIERLNKRDECLMQVSAIEKYQKFIEHYPKIENFIPHYHIASYLGMTPVTLSRLKGNKARK